MPDIRAIRPRVLRPYLSSRHQYLRRIESTTTPATPTPPSPRPSPRSFIRRNRSPLIWSTFALALGLMGGNMVVHTMAPPPMPDPGTHEDGVLMADLNKRIDEEFKVKVMRGKCLGVAKQLKGAEGGWVEIVPPPADQVVRNGERLVEQMQGAKGLGVERLFWDRGEQRLVAVVWLGGALSGWPGVTHGGVIATALSDKAALAASLAGGKTASVSAAAAPQRLPGSGSRTKMFVPTEQHDDPAQLSLSYVKPTHANRFYVIRASPSVELGQDPAHIVPSEPKGGHEYEATLETLEAQVCVKAKVKFAPNSTLQRVEEEVVGAVKTTYVDFKRWLWPSRQANSQIR